MVLFLGAEARAQHQETPTDESTTETNGPTEQTDESTTEPGDSSNADDSDFGGSGGVSYDEDSASVSLEATKVEPAVDPVVPATISEGLGDGSGAPADVEPPANNPACGEVSGGSYNSETDTTSPIVCTEWRICGQERIDDVVSGDIAGQDTTGRYRDYLNEVTGLISGDNFEGVGGVGDINSVNDLLIAGGLIDPPTNDAIAVFNWCATTDTSGTITMDLTAVSFAWTLNAADVYPIDAISNDLYTQLATKLELSNPAIGLLPDPELGYTIVQFPTWLFINNLAENAWVYNTNDNDTFRIDLRAVLEHVTWTYNNTNIATCTANQTLIYNPDTHHPINDLPDCHHIFNQLDQGNLTATITYKIEQAIRTAPSTNNYPPLTWTNYLDTPTLINLTTTIENYEIHPIYSINIAANTTPEDILTTLTNQPGN